MVISVTGHRPNKLFGYDLSDRRYENMKNMFKQILIKDNCDEAVTGMALGVDTIYALAVLELKQQGYDIKLHCAIPCRNHSCKWLKESKNLYNSILEKADKVVLVSDEDYRPDLMQKRNEYMVDLSDKVIAVWDGSKGGTYNCIKYAESVNKNIIQLDIDKF